MTRLRFRELVPMQLTAYAGRGQTPSTRTFQPQTICCTSSMLRPNHSMVVSGRSGTPQYSTSPRCTCVHSHRNHTPYNVILRVQALISTRQAASCTGITPLECTPHPVGRHVTCHQLLVTKLESGDVCNCAYLMQRKKHMVYEGGA